MDIDLIKKQMKEKRKNTYLSNASFSIKSNPYLSNASSSIKSNPKLFSFILRIMILTIIFLGSLIYTKLSVSNKQSFYDVVFKDNLSFAVINNFYNKYLGGILPFKDIIKDNKPVFKEKLTYREANIYKDGVSLSVDKEYLVPVLNSGIVIFVGEKEEYGKTVIIEQTNGIDVWYGNIDNLNVKLYDYVEDGSLIGETISDKLYLVFKKDGKALDYKEYIK